MDRSAVTLDHLNALDEQGFVRALDGIFENAPWVAAGAAQFRPFATVSDLHEALMRAVRQRAKNEQLAFLNAHPLLGGKHAKGSALTAESASEQASLGVVALAEDEARQLDALNATFLAKFSFPFIICARRQTRLSVLRILRERIQNDPDQEIAAALTEIAHISRLRLLDRVAGPGMPRVAGRLSTHVLDTHAGRPAQNVRVELFERTFAGAERLVEARTNADGRTDQPLLAGAPLRIGTYELVFHMGAYFRERRVLGSGQLFLDEVCVRFGIDAPEGDYHVPLVATPWSYSTYRGS